MYSIFNQKNLIIIILVLFGLSISLHYLVPNSVLEPIVRWIAELALLILCFKKRNLTLWIFGSMVFGLEIGLQFPDIAKELKILGKIFIKLIKTIIAPLLISTLVLGIAGHSNIKQIGRMGIKSILYFEVVTTIALVIGLVIINLTQAGVGIKLPADLEKQEIKVSPKTWQDHIVDIFPENIAKSIADNMILQVVIFSILFGIGLAMIKKEKAKPILDFMESLAEVMFKFTNIVMLFAPFAVGGAIAATVASMGFDVLKPLLSLVGSLYLGLFVFISCVLLPIALLLKIPIKKFIQTISEPVSIAFATASSESALPRAMEQMEQFGVPKKIVGFVLPTGYSFNLDGTTLYLSLASIFVAQAAGAHLSISEQVIICLTLMLTSKGVAGVARASMVILAATVSQFNLPMEPVYMILAVDVIMDMGRTATNVIGNCLATVVIAKWEGEFNPDGNPEDLLDLEEELV